MPGRAGDLLRAEETHRPAPACAGGPPREGRRHLRGKWQIGASYQHTFLMVSDTLNTGTWHSFMYLNESVI